MTYEKVSILFFFFLDIDECSTNSHSCDVNAVCSNNVGSYACSCKAGYTGNGNTCTGEPFKSNVKSFFFFFSVNREQHQYNIPYLYSFCTSNKVFV